VAAFHRNGRPESSGTGGRNPLEQVADFTGIRNYINPLVFNPQEEQGTKKKGLTVMLANPL
jgi:hypothetical protein